MCEPVRVSTGIDGLDRILKGGLVIPTISDNDCNGSVILLKGKPGTGKSTLALQIADAINHSDPFMATDRGEISGKPDVFYYSCEQSKKDIVDKCKTLELIREDKSEGYPYFEIETFEDDKKAHRASPDFTFSKLLWVYKIATQDKLAKRRVRLAVIDGLNLLQSKEREKFELEELLAYLRRYTFFSILVYDDDNLYADSMVDMILELEGKDVTLNNPTPMTYFINRMRITKSRLQKTALGWQQYKIREKWVKKDDHPNNGNQRDRERACADKTGIIVFPSFHNRVSSNLVPQSNNLMLDQLDESFKSFRVIENSEIPNNAGGQGEKPEDNGFFFPKIFGTTLKRGACTVILGNRRTLKSIIGMDFLRSGAASGSQSLLITLIDDISTTVGQKYPCFWPFTSEGKVIVQPMTADRIAEINNSIFPYYFQPGCITSDEFFYYLEKRLDNKNINYAAFWDLTQIEYKFPFLANDPTFLTGLINLFKQKNEKREPVNSLIMGAPYCKLAKSAYEMADNAVFCWREPDNSVFVFSERIGGSLDENRLFRLRHKEKYISYQQIDSTSQEGRKAEREVNQIIAKMVNKV